MQTPQPDKKMDILLVDDHPIVRFGFMALLKQIDETLVFGEAERASEALEETRRGRPRVAIVDLSLAGILSLDLIRRIRQISPATAILVVSMHDEKLYAARALKAGAKGYVMKQIAAKAISQAVQTVLDGKVWLSEELRADLINRLAHGASGAAPGLHSLSDRELAVFRLIGAGLRKGDIARELKLSPNTVETYRTNIKQKMSVASGAELYRIAFLHFQEESGAGAGADAIDSLSED